MNYAIVMTTWYPPGQPGADRRVATVRAAFSWGWYMHPAPQAIIIVDDGSDDAHTAIVATHNVSTPRLGTGGALNEGLRVARDLGVDAVFYGADDWELTEPLDLAPSLAILRDYPDRGMVRLGPTHPGLEITAMHAAPEHGGWFGDYSTRNGIVFAHRPALHAIRMYGDIGIDYPERVSAIEAERWLNDRAAARGWGCVHAPNATLAGPFRHIETVELGEDSPETLTERYGNA